MEFDEIMVMLLRSCNKRFTETVSLSEKLLGLCHKNLYCGNEGEK